MSGSAVDEEALAEGFSPGERRERGIFFTPAPLVRHVLERVGAYIPPHRALAVIDPACGAGAFLVGARERFPQARLHGLELSESSARTARERSGAEVLQGNALVGGVSGLETASDCELWVGNPPYNGTSSLLAAPEEIERIRGLLPGIELPRGTSLRDDFVLFLLSVAHRLRDRAGVMAFVTPASLLDAYVYAPIRRALLETLALREVISLGAGVFAGARVKTCVTLWDTSKRKAPVQFVERRGESRGFDASELSVATWFVPEAPDWTLRPEREEAKRLDTLWRSHGEPLDVAVPFSACGVKTRFDELLVDEDPERVFARVSAFLESAPEGLERFTREWAIPGELVAKLRTLRAWVKPGTKPERSNVRRFFRYGGDRHREGIPESAWAHCYLDRRLIPRGDHRMRGDLDPHACPQKLIFNLRELPLAATTIDVPGVVHMHRHARFAPLYRDGEANLSARAQELAKRLGSPWAAFQAIARFINSDAVQREWAPAYGTRRVVPVPLDALGADGSTPGLGHSS